MKTALSALTIYSIMTLSAAGAQAHTIAPDSEFPAGVSAIAIERTDKSLFITMQVDPVRTASNREILLTPIVRSASGADTLALPSVMIAGHNRYFLHLRDDKHPDYTLNRADGKSAIPYSVRIPYEDWMERATFSIHEASRGCCGSPISDAERTIADLDYRPQTFEAEFIYVPPVAEMEKVRELRGSAYIDFPVNRTELYPDYRNNPAELRKIIASVDTVKNDPDCRVTAMSFKGYASPEGPYDNNIRLARGRTATLRDYVCRQYDFPASIITTDFEPEDWEGLRRYVESSNLEHRAQILDIIDSNLAPDPKNDKLRDTYPDEYKFLLITVYPGLRHTDYKVDYVIRSFNDVEEIKRIMAIAPYKLSLNEFYVAANSMEPGSDEYNNVFETAVRMYPADEVANLNAANAAMSRSDYKRAAEYLDHAGTSAEVLYARGQLAAMQADYDTARELLARSASMGCSKATEAIARIDAIRTTDNVTFRE